MVERTKRIWWGQGEFSQENQKIKYIKQNPLSFQKIQTNPLNYKICLFKMYNC